jgi:anaerobic selenocysteine-containing dehydrogenase
MKWNSWVEINPETGRRLRIRDGDLVWVNPYRKLQVQAKLYPGAMPNVVNMPWVSVTHPMVDGQRTGRKSKLD